MSATKSRRLIPAVLLALTLCGTACSQLPDRAGGGVAQDVKVLTFADTAGSRPTYFDQWANEVQRRSGNTLRIDFSDRWRDGDPGYESGAIRDVQDGTVDGAAVGARVLDRLGVTSFQAMLAPLLIDSYELQARVFADGIPQEMLKGVDSLGVVGLGVIPVGMRRVLGVDTSFTNVDAFRKKKIATQDSAVVEASYKALGASPEATAGGVSLDGFDGIEAVVPTMASVHYEQKAHYLAANVNLWPRPWVFLIDKKVYEALTAEQRSALTEAAGPIASQQLQQAAPADDEAMKVLCAADVKISTASESELRALEAAVAPVRRAIAAQSPESKAWLQKIQDLKLQIAAPPTTASCGGQATRPANAKAELPEGTYTRYLTQKEFGSCPGQVEAGPPAGVWKLAFNKGLLTKSGPDGETQTFTYNAFRGRFNAHDIDFDIYAAFTVKGKQLRFTDMYEVHRVEGTTTCNGDTLTFGGLKAWLRQGR
jgi:TRAP-type C4-dicarboxylate transport system substrate-binding protein